MKRLILLLLYFHLSVLVYGQPDTLTKNCLISGRVENMNTGTHIGDSVKVELTDNHDSLLYSVFTTAAGKWKLNGLSLGKTYKITFSKSGYCKRFIVVDLMNIPDSTHSSLEVVVDIRLFDKNQEEFCRNSYNIEAISTAKLYYEPKQDDLIWDDKVVYNYKIILEKYLECEERGKKWRMMEELDKKPKQTEESKD